MTIYTRTGDKGDTGLFGGSRVSKNDPRVAAYGTVDELNCHLGNTRALIAADAALVELDAALQRVQGECFVVGTLLATPVEQLPKLGGPFSRGLPPAAPSRLESEIDSWSRSLTALNTFILPGGGLVGASLHVARAVTRRAEREVVDLSAVDPIPEGVLVYLNRLSTWLFVGARWANARQGRAETPWTGLPETI